MSGERGGGVRVVLAGTAVAGLLALFIMGGGDNPSTAEDESRSCAPEEMRVGEDCVNGHPMCPAPKVCPTVDTTPAPVPSVVEEASSTTQVPTLATVAPETTVVPMQQRPSSEAAPQPTAAPVEAPPETPAPTEPPAPAPSRPDPDSCARPFTIQAGDNSWAIVADRLDVWTRDLLALNGINEQTPRLVGDRWCAPPSVYGDGPAATQTPAQPETSAPATSAQEPPTTPPTTAPATTTTQASATTQPRRPPGSERTTTTLKPVWVQVTEAPTTTKAAPLPPKQPQQPPSPVTTRPGPGTVRTTAPPCPGC